MGRSPYGERGLKYGAGRPAAFGPSRSPYGERGLKYHVAGEALHRVPSLSLRRAWIEIVRMRSSIVLATSLSLRRAWIEITTRPT